MTCWWTGPSPTCPRVFGTSRNSLSRLTANKPSETGSRRPAVPTNLNTLIWARSIWRSVSIVWRSGPMRHPKTSGLSSGPCNWRPCADPDMKCRRSPWQTDLSSNPLRLRPSSNIRSWLALMSKDVCLSPKAPVSIDRSRNRCTRSVLIA